VDTLVGKIPRGQLTIILDEGLVEFNGDSIVEYTPFKIVRGEEQTSYFCDDFTLYHLFLEDMVYVTSHNEENIYEY
jgi:hypothetical protein